MVETLSARHFSPHLGSGFAVAGFEGVVLKLKVVSPCPPTPFRKEPFNLLFIGPLQPVLPQAIYRLESLAMEPVEIFLVPVGRNEAGIEYEAVFN